MKLSFKLSEKESNIIIFILFLIVILFLSVIEIRAFYPNEDFIVGFDTFFHLKRFMALHQAIENGGFPFFIDNASIYGYGYATNLFYPDFMLLPFTFFIDKLGLVTTYKLLLFTYSVLCGIVSYSCIKKIFKHNLITFLFPILYTFALYRLSDMSIRNSLGEVLAFTFFPIIILGIYEITFGDYKKKWYIIGIGFAFLFLTHILSSVLISIMLIIFLLINIKRFINEPKRFLYLVYGGILSILLASFFLFPMIEQMMDNSFYYETNPYVEELNEKRLLINWIIWGLFRGLTLSEPMTPDIGILLVLPILSRIFIQSKDNLIKFADISVILSLFLLFIGSELFSWRIFPFNKLSIIQFPWRFNMIVTLLLSISGSIYLYFIIPKTKTHMVSLCILFIGLTFISVKTVGGTFQGYEDRISDTNYDLDKYEMGNNEYIPSLVPSTAYLKERGSSTITTKKGGEILSTTKDKGILYFTVETSTNDNAELPLVYYKGYKATLNDKEIKLNQSKNGLVEISIPSSGKVFVWYYGTIIQRISLIISLLTLISLIIYIIINKRHERTKNHSSNILKARV